jgi:excisionase family DNA binding protein
MTATQPTPPTEPDTLLTLVEADRRLGITGTTGNFTRKLIQQRRIKAIRMGYRTLRVRSSEIDRYIKSREQAAIH